MPSIRALLLAPVSLCLALAAGCQGGSKPAPSKAEAPAEKEPAPAEPEATEPAPTLQEVCGHMAGLARKEWEAKQADTDGADTEGASAADEQVPDFEALERQCKLEVGRKKQKAPAKYDQMARCAVKAEDLQALFLCDPDAKKTAPKDPKLAPSRNDDAPPPLPPAGAADPKAGAAPAQPTP